MISIKTNKKPILPSCEMWCDKKLHPKLENYELTKQTSAARLSASRQREQQEEEKSPNVMGSISK
jgi:hypothetical protein